MEKRTENWEPGTGNGKRKIKNEERGAGNGELSLCFMHASPVCCSLFQIQYKAKHSQASLLFHTVNFCVTMIIKF